MPTPVLSVFDGPQVTARELVHDPLLIQPLVLDVLNQMFLGDVLLRNAGNNNGGLVEFFESTPLYADSPPETVAEFAEIPVISTSIGIPRIVRSQFQAFGFEVSQTMVERQTPNQVPIKLDQLRNSMRLYWDQAMVTNLIYASGSVPSAQVSTPWTSASATIRTDIMRAIVQIGLANPGQQGQQANVFGFVPDTIVMHNSLLPVFTTNNQMNMFNQSPLAAQAVAYTGAVPGDILGLQPMVSPSVPVSSVLICQRNRIGFYSDERPVYATPLYPLGGGGYGGPKETWRSDTGRKTALGLDQPLAGYILTGVQ